MHPVGHEGEYNCDPARLALLTLIPGRPGVKPDNLQHKVSNNQVKEKNKLILSNCGVYIIQKTVKKKLSNWPRKQDIYNIYKCSTLLLDVALCFQGLWEIIIGGCESGDRAGHWFDRWFLLPMCGSVLWQDTKPHSVCAPHLSVALDKRCLPND